MLTQELAVDWLDRWDRQQEFYIADREERFAVIADVVELTAGRPDPVVVDLGVGPGSLAVRLLDRLPQAQIVGVDADPLLLELARVGYHDRSGLRLVDRDLRTENWVEALGLDRAADAIVSTTALHWLTLDELGDVYRQCAQLLRLGGVLVNGDHLFEGTARPELDRITRQVGERRARRVVRPSSEDWAGWWRAAERAPELADLVARRGPAGVEHQVDHEPTVQDHLRVLHGAGFREAATVWQHGADRVLVGVR